jgi:hypothetical protein
MTRLRLIRREPDDLPRLTACERNTLFALSQIFLMSYERGPRPDQFSRIFNGELEVFHLNLSRDRETTLVYDSHVLHLSPIVARLVLCCIAAALWVMFLHEILFRSGKVRTHWVKKRFLDLLVMLSIALVTFVFALVLVGLNFHRSH